MQNTEYPLSAIFEKAQTSQKHWALYPLKQRAQILLQLRDTLRHNLDELLNLIHEETGKPRFEALSQELIPGLSLLTYYAHQGPKILAQQTLPMQMMFQRKSTLQPEPLGVVLIISPWNFPFAIPFGEVVMGLFAGNAVLLKPSSVTPKCGKKIQELCEASGIPSGLIQCLEGSGSLGTALIDQKPAKIFFTGSVGVGKKVMSQAAQHLIPVNLELGGKDPMIVLQDANLELASSAALWGGFFNGGQACASVERIIVHEKIADRFCELLAQKASQLRPRLDVGPVIHAPQAEVYKQQIEDARQKNCQVVMGGGFFENEPLILKPTAFSGGSIESSEVYREESFGPLCAITRFQSVEEAIQKANDNRFGLCASVFSSNLALAEQIARQIEAGTVTINEASFTHGMAETPWGGRKESGFGRTHSACGLLEFTHLKHINKPRFSFMSFKSPWWYPYTDIQFTAFRSLAELFTRSWYAKFRAFAHFAWNSIYFFKQDRRL